MATFGYGAMLMYEFMNRDSFPHISASRPKLHTHARGAVCVEERDGYRVWDFRCQASTDGAGLGVRVMHALVLSTSLRGACPPDMQRIRQSSTVEQPIRMHRGRTGVVYVRHVSRH